MPSDIDRLVQRLAGVFPDIMQTFHALGTSISRIPELTLPQFRVLLHLRMQCPCTLNEVAASLGMAQSSASELVTRMVNAGLLLRREHPHDRRVMLIELSERARRLLLQSEQALQSTFHDWLQAIPETERARFVEAFECIAALLPRCTRVASHRAPGQFSDMNAEPPERTS